MKTTMYALVALLALATLIPTNAAACPPGCPPGPPAEWNCEHSITAQITPYDPGAFVNLCISLRNTTLIPGVAFDRFICPVGGHFCAPIPRYEQGAGPQIPFPASIYFDALCNINTLPCGCSNSTVAIYICAPFIT